MRKLEDVKKKIDHSIAEMRQQLTLIPVSETTLQDKEEKGKSLVLTKSGFASPLILALITGMVCGIFIGIACMLYYYG